MLRGHWLRQPPFLVSGRLKSKNKDYFKKRKTTISKKYLLWAVVNSRQHVVTLVYIISTTPPDIIRNVLECIHHNIAINKVCTSRLMK